MCWKHGIAVLAAALLLSAGVLGAQERQPGDQPDRARANQREGAAAGAQQIGAQRGAEGRQAQAAQRIDQSVAAMLALGNFCEIQLAQLASQKSQNPQVKEFAQQMAQDHSQFLSKLQPFLPPGQLDDVLRGTQGAAPGAREGRPGAAAPRPEGAAAAAEGAAETRAEAAEPRAEAAEDNQVAQNQPGQDRTGRQPGAGRGEQGRDTMLQIQKEASQRALQMTKEILNQKQGAAFDKCYIGGAVTTHIQTVAKLEASQNHVSPELQQIIQQGQQTAEQHLKHAQTLAQQLEGARGAQPGAQPGQPPRAQPGAAPPGAAAAPRNE